MSPPAPSGLSFSIRDYNDMTGGTRSTAAAISTPRALTGLAPYLLALLSGTCIALPFLEPRLYVVGWFAFLPLLFAVEDRTLKQAWLVGTIVGSVAWFGASYWIADFLTLLKGYQAPWNYLLAVAYWLYAAQLFALIAVLFQWLRRDGRLPESWTFPLLSVCAFALFPMLFQARLGEGQSHFLLGLQAVELTGVYGLDFAMAMTAMLLYRLLRPRDKPVERWGTFAGVCYLLAWFGYGLYALDYWEQQITSWETRSIGIVQPNDAPSLEIPAPPPGYSRARPPEMEASRRLAERGAELVVWPEARFKGFHYQSTVREAYSEQVADMGSALLFHDIERERGEGRLLYYNTATVLDEHGELAGHYRKIKRIAFGEYLPVISEIPLLRQAVEGFLGEFLREISPGEAHSVFTVSGMRVVPKICYESAFPEFIADSIGSDGQGKIIVFQSQDGWFGHSNQPYMHLYSSVLRAVENRVPMVHVINNGPSAVVRPDGRIVTRTPAFAAAEELVAMPYSERAGGSFYSRHPHLFVGLAYALLGLAIALRLLRRHPAK